MFSSKRKTLPFARDDHARTMQLLDLNLDGNGKSTPCAERLLSNFEDGGGLLPLVLTLLNQF
jgi:hypothetical protein